jgi:hypothetical protein
MNTLGWAESEFGSIDLGDKRLSERLINIANHFMSSSESPINQACGSWADTKGAYRFFQNKNVDYQQVIQHHARQTVKRSKNEDVVLAIQDTTYFNYSAHPKTKNLGILSRFTGKYKKDIVTSGLYMHTTMAINHDGLPLGLLDQKITAREVLPKEKIELKKRSHNIALPIEEKESIRWLDSMRTTASLFAGQGKKVITIADREADIYDLFLLAEELDTHYLVRASHNRNINKTAIHSENSGEKLWDFLDKQKVMGTMKVKVPAKNKQPKRVAKCQIRIGQIRVLPPRSFKGEKSKRQELIIYTVQVVEKSTPKGADKIDWVLHTNLPIKNYDDAIEKVAWYCLRWRIEVYFKVIKSGFNVERCRLETAERLVRYLAVISIVAWKVFWLTLISRTSPNKSASEFFNQYECKVLFLIFKQTSKPPEEPPFMKDVVVWIAQLGGFLARKGDGYPGITHIWRGLKKLFNILMGVRLYGQICG